MSATNSRIAKLNRALKQLEDYEQHKADWANTEKLDFARACQLIESLIATEKLRRVA